VVGGRRGGGRGRRGRRESGEKREAGGPGEGGRRSYTLVYIYKMYTKRERRREGRGARGWSWEEGERHDEAMTVCWWDTRNIGPQVEEGKCLPLA